VTSASLAATSAITTVGIAMVITFIGGCMGGVVLLTAAEVAAAVLSRGRSSDG
jgi:poly(3-hydroxyalkanoate) synthetase